MGTIIDMLLNPVFAFCVHILIASFVLMQPDAGLHGGDSFPLHVDQ